MPVPAMALAAALLTVAGAVGLAASPRRRVLRRLKAMAPGRPPSPAPRRTGRRSTPPGGSGLALSLDRAGVPLTPREALVAAGGGAVLAGGIGGVAGGPEVGLLAAACAVAGAYGFLQWRISRRLQRLEDQLVDSLGLLVAALRAGHSLIQAVAEAAAQTPPPLGDLLRDLARENELGLPLEVSLERLARRSGVADVPLLTAAILVQRQVGGNLAEVLDHLAETLRERLHFRRKLRAMTAQNRLSMWFLTLLAPVVGVLMAVMDPSLTQVLWTTLLGRLLLATVAFLDLTGALVIRSLVRVEV
jgi:tight adherence protein B